MRTLSLLALLALASPAAAQTVLNPRTVEFAPSADHNATLPPDLGGGPVVTGYEARYFVVGSTTPICAIPLGKPSPVGSRISMPLPIGCVPPSLTTRYEVRVVALGAPGLGEGSSGPSNPFAAAGSVAAPTDTTVQR